MPGLVVAACRSGLGTAHRDDVARAAAQVSDWSGLAAAAVRHGVLPLVHAALADAAPLVRPAIPPDVLDELRRRFDENALRNIELARHLVQLAQRLATEGIAFMPIKGPTLAIAAYGNLALRQFGDLDLVIHRRDLARVRALLGADGFVPTNTVPESLDGLAVGTDYHLPLWSPALGIAIEVHWALGRRGLGSLRRPDWAWSNATTVTLLGRDLPTLDREAQIVYLCAHGAKHDWSQLARVCDVYAAIRGPATVDWDRVRTIASRARVGRMLSVGLGLCDALLGADLVARGWTSRPDPAARSLIAEAHTRCLTERHLSTRDALRLQLRARDRMVDRFLLSVDVLSSPHVADLNTVTLPVGFRALYYLMRPLRLAAKYGRRLIAR